MDVSTVRKQRHVASVPASASKPCYALDRVPASHPQANDGLSHGEDLVALIAICIALSHVRDGPLPSSRGVHGEVVEDDRFSSTSSMRL